MLVIVRMQHNLIMTVKKNFGQFSYKQSEIKTGDSSAAIAYRGLLYMNKNIIIYMNTHRFRVLKHLLTRICRNGTFEDMRKTQSNIFPDLNILTYFKLNFIMHSMLYILITYSLQRLGQWHPPESMSTWKHAVNSGSSTRKLIMKSMLG